MASQFDPRKSAPKTPCTNAPDPHVLRTSQTLKIKAEIPQYHPNSKEPAPRMLSLFNVLQARYG
ncbi:MULTISPECIES: hypothetical protein [Rhodobacterales]|uniref:hypothetical protein n=1 Tax=Roseobacter sp. N2S TaxID=2663844 RepID=UPI002863F252|nr:MULTISPECIES: hypothetical protein [Rhodobacterales]MDR6263847.1 hypothetical protein [Roseobacter sp. N2S]